jgi:DNA-binding transcriptional MerR regulator
MSIGEAADAAGVSAKMVRHHEQIGLMPTAARSDSGYSQYTERDVSILHFVRQSRRPGFSTAQIADLLGLWSTPSPGQPAGQGIGASTPCCVAREDARDGRDAVGVGEAAEFLPRRRPPARPILEALAVSSEGTPTPGTVGTRTAWKPGAQPAGARADTRAEPTAAIERMAWTRSAHASRSHH